jgi:lysophospholipase L1-like esterase
MQLVKRLPLMLFLLSLPACILPAYAQRQTNSSFALRNNDRVVFFGDSITAQRRYTRFAEDFIVSRYPSLRISFINAGVSGDTVNGGHAGDQKVRLDRDVFAFHPTVVTSMMGMNDGRYTTGDFEKNLTAYEDGYRQLIQSLQTHIPGVRVVLIRPSPYDEIAHRPIIAGYNGVMLQYGEFLGQLGRAEHLPVVDFNHPVTDALRAGMLDDPKMAGSLLPDRIHPAEAGHWIMAAALAKGWHVDPVVSRVTLDASSGAVVAQENTAVSQLKDTGDRFVWTQLDRSLPLPLELNDAMTQFLLRISEIPSLDQQMLRVMNLTAPRYKLLIDGDKIAEFTPQQLADGVNLALLQTPMEQQAKAIDWTAQDRAKLSGTRFNLLTEMPAGALRDKTVAELDALDKKMIDGEYQAAQPKPHTFELTAETK